MFLIETYKIEYYNAKTFDFGAYALFTDLYFKPDL